MEEIALQMLTSSAFVDHFLCVMSNRFIPDPVVMTAHPSFTAGVTTLPTITIVNTGIPAQEERRQETADQ